MSNLIYFSPTAATDFYCTFRDMLTGYFLLCWHRAWLHSAGKGAAIGTSTVHLVLDLHSTMFALTSFLIIVCQLSPSRHQETIFRPGQLFALATRKAMAGSKTLWLHGNKQDASCCTRQHQCAANNDAPDPAVIFHDALATQQPVPTHPSTRKLYARLQATKYCPPNVFFIACNDFLLDQCIIQVPDFNFFCLFV